MDQIKTGGWESEESSVDISGEGWAPSEDEEMPLPEPFSVPKTEDTTTLDTGTAENKLSTGDYLSSEESDLSPSEGLSVPEDIVEEEVGDISVAPSDEKEDAAGAEVLSTQFERRVNIREEKLVSALGKLLQSSNEIEAAALISLDGLMIASALPTGVEEDRVAAMSAAILSLGERAASELGRGDLSQVFLEGVTGFVFMMSTGGKAVLTALARKTAKLGLVFYDMKNTAKEIGEIL